MSKIAVIFVYFREGIDDINPDFFYTFIAVNPNAR